MTKAESHLIRRAGAALVDYGLLFCLTIAVFRFQPWLEPDETGNYGAVGFLLLLPIILAWCAQFVVAEARRGQTLGKALFDLAVERTDRKPLQPADCLKRHLLDPVEFLFPCVPGAVAMVAVKVTPGHQRLGDMVAGTHVVLRRHGEPHESGS